MPYLFHKEEQGALSVLRTSSAHRQRAMRLSQSYPRGATMTLAHGNRGALTDAANRCIEL